MGSSRGEHPEGRGAKRPSLAPGEQECVWFLVNRGENDLSMPGIDKGTATGRPLGESPMKGGGVGRYVLQCTQSCSSVQEEDIEHGQLSA